MLKMYARHITSTFEAEYTRHQFKHVKTKKRMEIKNFCHFPSKQIETTISCNDVIYNLTPNERW